MLEKNPAEVISDIDALERYLDGYLREEGITFEEWVPRFGRDFYARRNEILLDLAAAYRPGRVLELACAGPFLAMRFLERFPEAERFTCTNFSERMVAFCAAAVEGDARIEAAMLDAEPSRSGDLAAALTRRYDLVVTTSLEHIQADRDLVAALPPGMAMVCSVARFDDVEHFRVFDTEQDIRDRYGDLLRIEAVRENPERNKYVFAGVRPPAGGVG